jgi:hypothetical protein
MPPFNAIAQGVAAQMPVRYVMLAAHMRPRRKKTSVTATAIIATAMFAAAATGFGLNGENKRSCRANAYKGVL